MHNHRQRKQIALHLTCIYTLQVPEINPDYECVLSSLMHEVQEIYINFFQRFQVFLTYNIAAELKKTFALTESDIHCPVY